MTQATSICPDCGGVFDDIDGVTHKYLGGSPGCWATFNEVLAREFQDIGYFAVHRQTVDAYTAQHPGDQTDRRAAQSVNIHLTALYLTIEDGKDDSYARGALGELAKRYKSEFKPLTPPQHYDMTVKDVLAAETAEDHCRLVREWARAVWRAWEDHHDTARAYAQRIAN